MNRVWNRMQPCMGKKMRSVWAVVVVETSMSKQTTTSGSSSNSIFCRSLSTRVVSSTDEASSSSSSALLQQENNLPSIQLYQYAICPFCNIVKTVLDYAQLPYQAIEVNPLTKKELKWSPDYRKVPILVMEKEPMFGSDVIVQQLLSRSDVQEMILQKNPMWKKEFDNVDSVPSEKTTTTTTNTTTMDWIQFARDELAVLLYPNICATWNDSFQSFSYVHTVPTFTPMEKHSIQWLGSIAMYMAASKIKRKRNLENIRLALEEQLLILEVQGCLKDQLFLSGTSQPNMSDLTVFGTLRAIEGFPIHTELVLAGGNHDNKQQPPPLAAWYARMKEHI